MTSTEFDLTGQLPRQRLLLEASAGTGKTFSIAAVVTRLVAEEDIAIGRMLVVTFTKAAAAELRDRIRGRIADSATTLSRVIADPSSAILLDDELTVHLTAGTAADLEIRYRRLERALAEFDTATIGTIHSFAQTLLADQGVASVTNPDAVLTEDTTLVLNQAIADVLARRGTTNLPAVDVRRLTSLAKLVIQKPNAILIPSRADVEEARLTVTKKAFLAAADELAEMADAAAEVAERVVAIRRSRAIMGFDDLLQAAAELVTDPYTGARAVEEIRSRIDIALIDEFQDTDSTQWKMLEALFGSEQSTLITVGDPKQSIYRFRGADIKAYIQSARNVNRATLKTNYRSDAKLLAGVDALFADADFGSGINFESVRPGADLAELRISEVSASGVEVRALADSKTLAEPGRVAVGRDVARLVVDHLKTGQLSDRHEFRDLRPGDFAVLVKAHAEVDAVARSLTEVGVPYVIGKVGSVMATEAASQLFALLQAIATPASARRVRAAALGWFCHRSWEELDGSSNVDEPGLGTVAELQTTFTQWAEVLQREGIPAFFNRIWEYGDVAVRLLEAGQGERSLTDLNHIRELLETEGQTNQIHLLLDRMEQLMTSVDGEEDSDLFARRTDSDDNAVQIMTVHAAKGLEFPIVLALGLQSRLNTNRPYAIDEAVEGTRTVVHGNTKTWEDGSRDSVIKGEEGAERLRLIYVAVTRAAHKAVIYLGSKPDNYPLSKLLFSGPAPLTGQEVKSALEARSIQCDGALRATVIDDDRPLVRWSGSRETAHPGLDVARLGRDLDRDTRRWSFTRISARRLALGEHVEEGSAVMLQESGPEQGVTDEATPDGLTVDDSDELGSELPLGNIAGGAAFGTLVHGVLEEIDFASERLAADLASQVEGAVQWSNWRIDPDELSAGLLKAIDTPLGPLFDGRTMRSFGPADVLDEMTFELPLAPTVAADNRPTGAAIGRLILSHLPNTSLLRPWAQGLAEGEIGVDLAGHLTGAIDGIFRVRAENKADRYVVVDYKTNRLGNYRTPLQQQDYSEAGMAIAMAHHDYPLQALLYSVALHRYLRWRLGSTYDPGANLGGAAYLFIRGMTGPGTPMSGSAPHGVFSWAIPPELVVALSDLLHSGTEAQL